MNKIYIQTLVEDELPKGIEEAIHTDIGLLVYMEANDIWITIHGPSKIVPTWWLKEVTIEELTAKKEEGSYFTNFGQKEETLIEVCGIKQPKSYWDAIQEQEAEIERKLDFGEFDKEGNFIEGSHLVKKDRTYPSQFPSDDCSGNRFKIK